MLILTSIARRNQDLKPSLLTLKHGNVAKEEPEVAYLNIIKKLLTIVADFEHPFLLLHFSLLSILPQN